MNVESNEAINLGAIGGGTFGGVPPLLGSPAAALYPNIESFPGQIMVTPPLLSARQETAMPRAVAVRGARHVERTNAHLHSALERKADMTVGASLRISSKPNWKLLALWHSVLNPGVTEANNPFTAEWAKDFSRKAELLFSSWANDPRMLCDGEGHHTFGGQMRMAYRNLTGPDAEMAAFIQYDPTRRSRFGTPWATYQTILDPDRIDTPAEHSGDANVVSGRRLDDDGRMIGFYCRRKHAGDYASPGDEQYVFIPRESATGSPIGVHYFGKNRGGAQRGITTMVTILKQATMLDKFDNAVLGAAVLAAAMATWIESGASPETAKEMIAPSSDNASGSSYEQFYSAKLAIHDKLKVRFGEQRIPVFPIGDKLHFETTNREAPAVDPMRMSFLRYMASAIGTTTEQLSNNYSEANYSSIRAALVDITRSVLSDRALFGPQLPALSFSCVVEEALAMGWLELPPGAPPFRAFRHEYARCSIMGPGFGWVDPLKEAQAMLLRLNAKVSNRQMECAAQGLDYEEVLEQWSEEIETAAALDPPVDLTPAPQVLPASEPADDPSAEPPKRPAPPPASRPTQPPPNGDGR